MVVAIWGGSFLEPSPWQWMFGAGIGTNIGASIIWGFAAGLLGMFVARKVKAAWAHLRAHQEHQSRLVEEMHHLAHTGKEHPRVRARRDAGEHPTPERKDHP
ncbi:MAG: hypothetical protein WAU42_04060 [Solirubrobacteraceae bacterium]